MSQNVPRCPVPANHHATAPSPVVPLCVATKSNKLLQLRRSLTATAPRTGENEPPPPPGVCQIPKRTHRACHTPIATPCPAAADLRSPAKSIPPPPLTPAPLK